MGELTGAQVICDCVKLINADLAKRELPNTMIETPLFGPQITFVLTCKRHENVRSKPKRVFASYCPFCGEKYPNHAATISDA